MILVAVAALAAPENDAERIVVYGDPFGRWDHTRWSLQSELMLPLGAEFASDEDVDFRSFGFQVRAVVTCDKDAPLGKRRWEVSCRIEDIGIRATSENRWHSERDRRIASQVLKDVDDRLTGARVQMQVDEDGAIADFDLEGVDATVQRERRIQETTRQLMTRVMAGFHLRDPLGKPEGEWVEYNPELIDLPSISSARGSSLLLHRASPHEDMRLVQSVGEGAVTVSLPKDSRDPFHPGLAEIKPNTEPRAAGGGIGFVGPSSTAKQPRTPSASQSRESAIEATFAVKASGVAVFDDTTGILVERVWEVTGEATASGPWGLGRFRNVGHLRQIGPNDVVDVGESVQVSWPSTPMDGLAPWTPIESVASAR